MPKKKKNTASAVMVSRTSFENADPFAVVASNISIVNAMREDGIPRDAIPARALQSYYVDFYNAQLRNGRFYQFAYNTRLHPRVLGFIREGLKAMGAAQQLALFEEQVGLINAEIQAQLDNPKTGDGVLEYQTLLENLSPSVRIDLDEAMDDYYALSKTEENLIALNASWLRGLPDLIVLPIPEIEEEIARRKRAFEPRPIQP